MWVENTKRKIQIYRTIRRSLSGKSKRVSVIMPNKTRQTQKEASYILNNKIATKIKEIESTPKEIKFSDLYDEWFNRYKNK